MKELYLFLTELITSHDNSIFVDLYKSNHQQDVITTPSVLIDISGINFREYKKDVLLAEVQGKLHYLQDEYTDSDNQSNTQQNSLMVLDNVQKLIGKIHLASNNYFSQIQVRSIEQISEVTNVNTFVIGFSTYFLLKRDVLQNALITLNLQETVSY
jgi:hypothetical protein